MNLFLHDIGDNAHITWDNLIEDIKNTSDYNPYCKSNKYYEVFKHIILSLILGEEIILLDSDFTDSELINLSGQSTYDNFNKSISDNSFSSLTNKKDLLCKLKDPSNNWKMTLYTSGTTGIPKKVSHNFKSISRFVKTTESHKEDIWGFAYNPTHMAGVQVFFQALLNGNSIIRLFGLQIDEIYNEIYKNNITHISATPTFYKLMLPCDKKFKSVQRITSGGEKFNSKTFELLNKTFPLAKITNVYASTEAGTLFASQDDIFSIIPKFSDLIRINKNELLIHKSLLGNTDEDFNEWYHTGDLIEVVNETPLQFRFLNRKSEMINVGGYKINPHEIEDAILSIPGIINSRVYSKPNSVMGNIIYCEVISNDDKITEQDIRTYLQTKVQEFKIPRIISFVKNLPTTRTGKIKRSSL